MRCQGSQGRGAERRVPYYRFGLDGFSGGVTLWDAGGGEVEGGSLGFTLMSSTSKVSKDPPGIPGGDLTS